MTAAGPYSVVHLAILYEIRTGCPQALGGTVQSCAHRRHLHRSTRLSASARSLNVSSIGIRSLPIVRRAQDGPSSISRCWSLWDGVIVCSRDVGRAVLCVGRWGRSSFGFRCRSGTVLQATAVPDRFIAELGAPALRAVGLLRVRSRSSALCADAARPPDP